MVTQVSFSSKDKHSGGEYKTNIWRASDVVTRILIITTTIADETIIVKLCPILMPHRSIITDAAAVAAVGIIGLLLEASFGGVGTEHSSHAVKMFPQCHGRGATVSIRLIVFMHGLVYHCMLAAATVQSRIHLVTSLDLDAAGAVVVVMILMLVVLIMMLLPLLVVVKVMLVVQGWAVDRCAISSSGCWYY